MACITTGWFPPMHATAAPPTASMSLRPSSTTMKIPSAETPIGGCHDVLTSKLLRFFAESIDESISAAGDISVIRAEGCMYTSVCTFLRLPGPNHLPKLVRESMQPRHFFNLCGGCSPSVPYSSRGTVSTLAVMHGHEGVYEV